MGEETIEQCSLCYVEIEKGDDSFYFSVRYGPFCENCYDFMVGKCDTPWPKSKEQSDD